MRLRKITALLLIAVLMISLLPTTGFAAARYQDEFEPDRVRFYGCNAMSIENGGVRDDDDIGWMGNGSLITFWPYDFGTEPFFRVNCYVSANEPYLAEIGKSTEGGFEIYIDEVTPENLVAVCEDTVDTQNSDVYHDNWVDLKGLTGEHSLIFKMTDKDQNFRYIEVARKSMTHPNNQYVVNELSYNQEASRLDFTATIARREEDVAIASTATLAVAFYDETGLLTDIKIESFNTAELVLDGTKSYAANTITLPVDVSGMSENTTVKAFLWDNLFSQDLLGNVTEGKIIDFLKIVEEPEEPEEPVEPEI